MSTTLQETTDARKARLLELRAARDRKRKATEDGALDDSSSSIAHRAYDVSKAGARAHDLTEEDDTVESQVKGVAEDIVKRDAARRKEELDLFNIQPKKPNWDLKRDVEKKMSKLEYQTKSAIANLIRQRIAQEKAKNGGEGADASEAFEANAALAGGQADLAKALEQRTVQELSDAEDD